MTSPLKPDMIDRRYLCLTAAAGLFLPKVVAAQDRNAFFGAWYGVVSAGAVRMRLRFDIAEGPRATLTSLDEGNDTQEASQVSISGSAIVIEFAKIAGRFSGTLVDGRIDGQWHQGFQSLPLVLTRASIGPDESAARPVDPAAMAWLRQRRRIPALGAGWRRPGRAPVVICDGFRSSEANAAVTPSDQWHWGSITKPMTATLAAVLVEQGRLNWSDTVGGILGNDAPDMQDAYRDASLLHLLSHRAGMAGDIPLSLLRQSRFEELADGRAERLRFTRELLRLRPAGRPGGSFVYSNSGYIVAGAMMEKQTGRSFEDLMRRHIFQPLGLASAGFGAPDPGIGLDQPLGHYEPDWTWKDGRGRNPVRPGGKRPADNCFAFGPAGRAHMSIADMLGFLSAHASRDSALLRPGSWQTLHTPPFGGTYALGWEVRNDGKLWHNGSNTYWYGEVLADTATGTVAAAVANDGLLDITQPVVDDLLGQVWAAAVSEP